MGLISKILDRESAITALSPTVGTPSADLTTDPLVPSFSNPIPCPVCGSPFFWIDVYQGGPHCRSCNEASSPTMIDRHILVVGPPGEFHWERSDLGKFLGRPGVADSHPSVAAHVSEDGEFQQFKIPASEHSANTARTPVNVLARIGRVNQTRLAGPSGLYSPPLVAGPVGDLTIDEWIDRVAEPPPRYFGQRRRYDET